MNQLLKSILVFLLWGSFVGSLQAVEAVEGFTFESRDEVPEQYKWDMTLLHESWDDWESGLRRMEELYNGVMDFKDRLSESPETLLEALRLLDEAGKQSYLAYGYPAQLSDLDSRDNEAQQRLGQFMGVISRVGSNLSWIEPEILSIPQATMMEWLKEHPGLEPYRFSIEDTYRTGHYTLDEKGEKLLSLHGIVRGIPENIFDAITDADGERPEVTLSTGETIKLTPGLYGNGLNVYRDPVDRRAIQEAWMEQFEDKRNTFAAIYNGVLQQGWALAQSRGYASTLQMKLNRNNVPQEVVTSLVETARSGAAHLQRYQNLRKAYLGLEAYGWSDMHVPLLPDDMVYPYDEVMPMIVDSVGFLKEEYQTKMEEQFTGGFVDVFETPNKRSGAYNTGRYGVGSFVLLNYHGRVEDVFTVAHEMGHSMHTRLSQEYQPYVTHSYTIFVAEVASTLNEKLLLKKFLGKVSSPRERVALLEHQLEEMKNTFFLQTMMADFEIQAHALVEKGAGITADRLTGLWKSTVQAYYGDVIPEDDPYMISWARIPHIYNSPFYVYQYATCFASAASFMKQMESDPAAIDRYLELLKSGGNDYPMNQLKKAGVDLTNPEVLRTVVEEFGHLVDLLEVAYTQYLEERKIES